MLQPFELERLQSIWENQVEINLSESGIHPVRLSDLRAMGLDMDELERVELGYVQTNGSVALREALARLYPGATPDHLLVTNGGSEANFVTCLTLLREGDEVLFETPNYMQFRGIPPALGAEVRTFALDPARGWSPDWEGLERGLSEKTRLVYISHPNNPTGATMTREEMERLVAAVEGAGAWLVADEVYLGAELEGDITPSFWGMSERVIVTSGLSKAYGIPGARIGWMVAPPQVAADAWGQKDYTSIAPGMLSDLIARTAVSEDVRRKLFARTREILAVNRVVFREWVESFGGRLEYTEPNAGAIAWVKYQSAEPSLELIERIRRKQSVLVVPGALMGMEGYLRFNLGPPRELLEEGLRRVGVELNALQPV